MAQNSPSPLISVRSFTYFMYFSSLLVSQNTKQNSTLSDFWNAKTKVPLDRQHHLQLGRMEAQYILDPAAMAILSPVPYQVISVTVSALGTLRFFRWFPFPSKNFTIAFFSSQSREHPATAIIVPEGFHLILLRIMEVSTAIGSSSLSFFIKIILPCSQATHRPTGQSSDSMLDSSNHWIPARGRLGVRNCSGSTTPFNPVILIWRRCSPFSSKIWTYPSLLPATRSLESGAQLMQDMLGRTSRPHLRLPSTPPTITWPSAQAIQILVPSGLHFMSATVETLRLLTISSTHSPLCFINTTMRPLLSQEVSLRYLWFQSILRTSPSWLLRSVFSALSPPACFCLGSSNLMSLRNPSLAPMPSHPSQWSQAHAKAVACEGTAIFFCRNENMMFQIFK